MTARRWLISSVVLAVLTIAAVIFLAIPNRLICPGATRPVPDRVLSFRPVWVCRGSHTNVPFVQPPATDHRVPLRVGIALGGVALAVALGVGLQKAWRPAQQADTDTALEGS
jgi:hypothetical protein